MSNNHSIRTYFNEVFQHIQDKKSWNSTMEFNTTEQIDQEPVYVNLSNFLQSNDNYPFPSHFNGIQNKSKLIMALRLSAMKAGFWLCLRTSKCESQLNKHQMAYLTLQCQHGIKFRHRPNSSTRNCKTNYSIDSDNLCPFRINVSLCKETNVWYLHCRKGKQKQIANLHKNHLRMDSSHIRTHISLFPEKDLKLITECSQTHINTTRIASLINIRNVLGINNRWTRYQIRYLGEKKNILSGLTSNGSSAELLIEALNDREDTNYLYMTFEPSEGLILMTGEI